MNVLDLAVPADLMIAVGPELLIMAGAMMLLLWAVWRPESDAHQRTIGVASIGICALTLSLVVFYIGRYKSATSGVVALDDFRWLMDVVILVGTGLTIGLSIDGNSRDRIHVAESHVLILLASSGMMLLAGARDLMIVFLGIELMSISVYALAAINRRSARGAEGALKYFLLGAFSTAFFLYGIALIYGATGTTNLTEIGYILSGMQLWNSPLALVGMAMLLIGFGFKVAAVPFHMWAPDVYDGAPLPITAYMAATVKAAAFTAFFRVWIEGFGGLFGVWYPALHGVAVASMIGGNAIGLAQRNMKRMLAYSSIGHAGYMLVAVASATSFGGMALVFYLFIYTLTTFGAFAVLGAVAQPGRETVMVDELSGLWKVRPWLALGMGMLMLALLGFPFFGGAGFFAKWYIILAAMRAPVPLIVLPVVLVLTSVVSAGYYLHVVMVMFMRPRPANAPAIAPMAGIPRAILVGTVALIFAIGLFPQQVVEVTMHAYLEYGMKAPATPGVMSPNRSDAQQNTTGIPR